jgi:hypothetical protein
LNYETGKVMSHPSEDIRVIREDKENKEDWKHLCERAAVEPDPERLMALIEEINRMLEAEEQRS